MRRLLGLCPGPRGRSTWRTWRNALGLPLLSFFWGLSPLLACGPSPRTPASATCATGRVPYLGACVEPALADRHCGKSGVFVDGACEARPCPGGQVPDLATGECLGVRALREIGGRIHVIFEEGQTLGCRDGARLRVANAHATCLEPEPAEPIRRATYACGAGEVKDEPLGRCVRVARDGAVDVAVWTRAVLGPDGGLAATDFCAQIGQDPSALALGSGAKETAQIAAELVFPNNDVTLVHARTEAHEESGRALPSQSLAAIEGALAERLEALRGLGGTASAASVAVRVRCVIRAGFQPIAVDPPGRSGNTLPNPVPNGASNDM